MNSPRLKSGAIEKMKIVGLFGISLLELDSLVVAMYTLPLHNHYLINAIFRVSL